MTANLGQHKKVFYIKKTPLMKASAQNRATGIGKYINCPNFLVHVKESELWIGMSSQIHINEIMNDPSKTIQRVIRDRIFQSTKDYHEVPWTFSAGIIG